jgi:hypothetical protein
VDPSRTRRGALLLAAYLASVVACQIYVRIRTWDASQFEERTPDVAWELELPWRATRGEWVGRDFQYPIGPLWQVVSLVGATPHVLHAGRAIALEEAAFAILSLALCAWVALRTARDPRSRFALFAVLALVAIGYDVSRPLLSVVALLLYVPLDREREDVVPTLGSGVPAAVATTLATLVSFDRGPMTLAAIAAAAVTEVAARRLARRPLLPAVRRFGHYAGALLAAHAILALLAWPFGASWLAWMGGSFAVIREYASGMILRWTEAPYPLDAVVVLFAGAIALAALHARRATFDLALVSCLAGTLPLCAPAIFRSDSEHIYQGLAPVVSVLLVTAVRGWESADPARRLPALAAAALPLLFAVGWTSRDPAPLVRWSPAIWGRAYETMRGTRRPRAGWTNDVTRAVAWARARKREGAKCISTYPGGTFIGPLAGVDGPVEVLLAWSGRLDGAWTSALERADCPYHLQRLFGFDSSTSSWLPRAFVLFSERYEPYEWLGPDLVALRRRARASPAIRRPLRAEGLGQRREVSLPGLVSFDLDRFVPGDHVLEIDYTLEVPAWARWLGTPPFTTVTRDEAQASIPLWTVLSPGRHKRLVAVDWDAVEARFVAGRSLHAPKGTDRLVIGFHPFRAIHPGSVAFTVHSLTEISSTAPEAVEPTVTSERIAIADEVRAGRAWPRAVAPVVRGNDLLLVPNVFPAQLAETFLPVTPRPDACFSADLDLASSDRAGDGAVFQVHVIDRDVRKLAAEERFRPGDPRRHVDIALAPWAGRPVLLRLGTLAGRTSRGDRTWLRAPRIAPCACRHDVDLVRELREGRARVRDAHPELGEDSFFLHPNPPGGSAAEVVFPARPCTDVCLSVGLELGANPAGGGDGADLEVDVVDGRTALPLVRRTLLPGERVAPARFPLDRFVGREVSLRFTTRPGRTVDYDWASFVSPRLEACP